MTFTGEENDEGYFSLTTTFSLKPTNQTSNPGVLIGISENSMETTGINNTNMNYFIKTNNQVNMLNAFFHYALKD